jgi:hypothetical protein
MKKWIALAVVALVITASVQFLIASLRQHDFEREVHKIALTVSADNHEEIKKRVVKEASKIGADTSAEQVTVQYAPTDELIAPQRMVSKLMTFTNHWATITVEFSQPILFIPINRRTEVKALIQSAGQRREPGQLPEP